MLVMLKSLALVAYPLRSPAFSGILLVGFLDHGKSVEIWGLIQRVGPIAATSAWAGQSFYGEKWAVTSSFRIADVRH